MSKRITVHQGIIRESLVADLETFRAPDRRVSSYYLNLDFERAGGTQAVRDALKSALTAERKRIDELEARHAIRVALHRDLEAVEEAALEVIGERHTRGMACFVASESGQGRALRLPWPVRYRAFFEDRFVVWPLRQVLDQSDRYAICLTDKDDARLFLFYLEELEEVAEVADEIPGRIRFPNRSGQLEYMRKHIEAFHQHFDNVSERALRLLQREPFEHLIIGGLWEVLPQFESRLHRYLRDRIIARWDIDIHTPLSELEEKVPAEERAFLEHKAQQVWKEIEDNRPKRGALGPDEVFAALWRRGAQVLLADPDAARPGFRCKLCTRLRLSAGPCPQCGESAAEDIPNAYEESVQDAIDQSSEVHYWKDPALEKVQFIAALRRF